MKAPNRLLAKSYASKEYGDAPPDYALLLQHSRDVATACKALAQSVGKIALHNCGLATELFERLSLALLANGWIQDLGKSGSHFQEMVRSSSPFKQLIRHEVISGLLVWQDERLREWLSPISDVLVDAVWGAMGHHRKFHEQTKPEQVPSLAVYVTHDDFAAILREMRDNLKLDPPPKFDRDIVIARGRKDGGDFSALESLRDLQDEFKDLEAEFADSSVRRLLALIKAFGIAADVAASAVAKQGRSAEKYSLSKYVEESLTAIGLTTADLTRLINKWAWDRSSCDEALRDETKLPPDVIPRDFQNKVAASDSFLTLAQAGCGSGKSLAAYMWALEWCQKLSAEGRTNFRLFFCLPTTGTTTEHFKDYALESGISPSLLGLTHSRSSVDLKAMAMTSPQEEADEDETDMAKAAQAALNAERDKIESLALWSTPLVVTTADTVLGLMSNARRSVYSFPAIMSGAIVFDEIHAFDEQMFGHLLVFLKNFPRLPVLLMTASLPEERLSALKMVRDDLTPIPGPPEFETLERYLINASAADGEMWQMVSDCVVRGKKILWVRNRVDWANEIYYECRRRFPGVTVNVYHSRFRYKDRSIRHRRVIDRFKREGEATILVATQVAEMSLDLSADLLISDIAPIPALIQRMGRLNRRSTPDKPQPAKPALIRPLPRNESNVELPYDKGELAQTERWLHALIARNKALHQRDLSEAFADLSEVKEYDLAAAEERACFFSGLWRTKPGTTRGEGHTVTVILEADLKAWRTSNSKDEPPRDWLREHEVSILFKQEVLKWERVGMLRVAPSAMVEYDFDEQTKEGTGAKWRKN
jgi:CRISPR-associated endonuclease/helicase Cas3